MAIIDHEAELTRAGAHVSGRWGQLAFLARRYPLGAVGAFLVFLFVFTAVFANFIAPGDPTSTVLQNCASGLDKFFLVKSANQTLTVFNSIGTSLSKLRVAK